MKVFKILIIFLFLFNLSIVNTYAIELNTNEQIKTYLKNNYPKESTGNQFIIVSIPKQELYLIKKDKIVSTYSISTSKNGVGNITGSNKTPLGLHIISNKIGAKVPLGGIIKAGKYTGKISPIITEHKSINTDLLTTRELILSGLEKGKNKGGKVDSYMRGIIIHGTPEEGLIGEPASHGCIRLKNKDIISLYNQVEKNTKVFIENEF